MALRIGLGASQSDLEVQGEIDFDFFNEDEVQTTVVAEETNPQLDIVQKIPAISQNPIITVSYHYDTGEICKTAIETTIPSPAEYKGNKCGTYQGDNTTARPSSATKQRDIPSITEEDENSETLSLSSSDSSFDDDFDSMTDVTPLPSPCPSPVAYPNSTSPPKHENNLNFVTVHCEEILQRNISVQSPEICNQSPVDVNLLMKAVEKLDLDQQSKKSKNVEPYPFKNKYTQNLTFSNEEVRHIDKENQRLLKRITAQQSRSIALPYSNTHSRPSSSSINRRRQQRQIEADNLALLRRLEAAQVSKELNRTQLLREYEYRNSVCSSRSSTRPVSRSSTYSQSIRNSARVSGRSSSALSSNPGLKNQKQKLERGSSKHHV